MSIDMDKLTLGELKLLRGVLLGAVPVTAPDTAPANHPMLGRRCLVRTYSAGVHIGDVVAVEGMECRLENALRLWSWSGGGLSLSAIANKGVVEARIDRTGEVYLTNCIEFIPTTQKAEESYARFIED